VGDLGPAADLTADLGEAIPCDKHVDCAPYAMACIDGFCGRDCTEDWHCGEKGSCVGYTCHTNDVVTEDDSGSLEDALPEGCEPTPGPYGAACSCKQECASALCVHNKVTNSAMCTQYCQNPAQCPGSDICVQVEHTFVCILNDSGQSTSCEPDAAMCYSGDYLQSKLSKCACTSVCTKAADCPEGFGCHLIGVDKYCVSTGEPCSTDYNPCFGQCAGDPRTGIGFCTAICLTSADCPEAWTCQPLAEGVSVCASPF